MYVRTIALRSRASGVVWGLVLTYLFWGSLIYQCGDCEKNPGPETAVKGGASASANASAVRQTPWTRLNARSASADRTSTVSDSLSSPSQKSGEPTLTDILSAVKSLNTRFDDLKGDLSDIRNSQIALQGEVQELRDKVSDLTVKNETLQSLNDSLVKKVEAMERKTDDLEGRSKRNNLIIHGLEKTGDESWEDCEGMVQDLLTDRLEMSQDVQFDRVHRLNGKANSPIVARCTFYKDKVSVLKAKKKLQGTQISIGEDYTARVRDTRKKLAPYLKKAKGEGKRAAMVFDHLIINGQKFCLNDKGDNIRSY